MPRHELDCITKIKQRLGLNYDRTDVETRIQTQGKVFLVIICLVTGISLCIVTGYYLSTGKAAELDLFPSSSPALPLPALTLSDPDCSDESHMVTGAYSLNLPRLGSNFMLIGGRRVSIIPDQAVDIRWSDVASEALVQRTLQLQPGQFTSWTENKANNTIVHAMRYAPGVVPQVRWLAYCR